MARNLFKTLEKGSQKRFFSPLSTFSPQKKTRTSSPLFISRRARAVNSPSSLATTAFARPALAWLMRSSRGSMIVLWVPSSSGKWNAYDATTAVRCRNCPRVGRGTAAAFPPEAAVEAAQASLRVGVRPSIVSPK